MKQFLIIILSFTMAFGCAGSKKGQSNDSNYNDDWFLLTFTYSDDQNVPIKVAENLQVISQPTIKEVKRTPEGYFLLKVEKNLEYKISLLEGISILATDKLNSNESQKNIKLPKPSKVVDVENIHEDNSGGGQGESNIDYLY